MWTSSELKMRARQNLSGRYGRFLVIVLIYEAIITVLDKLIAVLTPHYTAFSDWLFGQYAKALEEAGIYNAQLAPYFGITMTTADFLIDVAVSVAGLLMTLLVYNVLEVGLMRYFMESRSGGENTTTLFSGFRNGQQWGNVVGTRFFVKLYTFLWSLLLCIPGIVYIYKTILVPYLLAENPYMSRKRAIELSKALTNGEKGAIFFLQLSFIGWYLLIGIAGGLIANFAPVLASYVMLAGIILLLPYYQGTMAELYAYMRDKAFRLNLSDASELAGFASAAN